MTKVIVTGGHGKLGRACVQDLTEHGYDVLVFDSTPAPRADQRSVQIDLSDFGQTLDAFLGLDNHPGQVDAVVHLAAIPAPGRQSDARTYQNNTGCSFNVFHAAKRVGIKNIVFASSETVLGLPFDTPPPYVPVDEEYEPRPETSYSLGKVIDETLARHLCRQDPDLKMYGLRLSNVKEPAEYAAFSGFDSDARLRKWNLWAYIDARDGAQAVRKAVEHPGKGFETFIIANADTVMTRPNKELMAEAFPSVPFRRDVGPNETLLSIEKARRVLGYEPRHSWRDRPL
jgi:nucleoside-diphosphate-sugar epimerase